jgi:putative phosphoribosyl transferase
VARALGAPLDVFVVRKLGVPGHEELAMGAIASGGVRVHNEEVVRKLHIDDATIQRVAEVEEQELARRERSYRGQRPPPDLTGRVVILVDDGLATGSTMRAAVAAARAAGPPARVVVAVPVGPAGLARRLGRAVDEVVVLETPQRYVAVGQAFADFPQVTDEEVLECLRKGERPQR